MTVLRGHGYEVERADRGYWVRWPDGRNWRRVMLRAVPLARMAEAVKLGMQVDGQGRAVQGLRLPKGRS